MTLHVPCMLEAPLEVFLASAERCFLFSFFSGVVHTIIVRYEKQSRKGSTSTAIPTGAAAARGSGFARKALA